MEQKNSKYFQIGLPHFTTKWYNYRVMDDMSFQTPTDRSRFCQERFLWVGFVKSHTVMKRGVLHMRQERSVSGKKGGCYV